MKHRLFAVKTRKLAENTFLNPTPRLEILVKPSGKGTPFRFHALPDTGCTTTVMSQDLQRAYGFTLHKTKETLFTDTLPAKSIAGPKMKIHLKEGAKPRCVTGTKPIPHHWQAEAAKALKGLLDEGIIEKVPIDEPCEWVSPAFFVPRADGSRLRLVTDFSYMNKWVHRPVHPFPSASDIIQALPAESKVFAKLDAVMGYHQIPLDEASKRLTTFLLPSGRYRYLKGPMGLSSTGDEWCHRSDVVVEDIPGASKIVDDILIAAKNYTDLNTKIRLVLDRCKLNNMAISKRKFKIGSRMTFAGFLISADGVEADPAKVKGITNFPTPTCTKDIKSFLGLAQQLACFVTDLAATTKPLRDLLKKDVVWTWSGDHEKAFQKVKKLLTSSKVLSFYNPELETILLTDASKLHGLGYALMQKTPAGNLCLVHCGSRAISDTESRYAPIEQECLAVQWGIHKCRHYLLGNPNFKVITDHRPLVGLFQKSLGDIDNRRLQRLREKLVGYVFEVEWVAGRAHEIADALSRYPVDPAECSNLIATISCVSKDLKLFASECQKDQDYLALIDAIRTRTFQDLAKLSPDHVAHRYKPFWSDLSLLRVGAHDVIVYKGDRLEAPSSLHQRLLKRLHTDGHAGTTKMRQLAQELVHWPGIGKDIADFVAKCPVCFAERDAQPHEPLIPRQGTFPMESIGCDLFQWDGNNYLAVVDRYSGFLWFKLLRRTATKDVTKVLMDIFEGYGFPLFIESDNGPQFREPFLAFCEEIGATHTPSSAYNPSSNGLAESAVKISKSILKKAKADHTPPMSALSAWRNTPRADGTAPADLLFGFRQRVPSLPPKLSSQVFVNREERAAFRQQRKEATYAQRGGTPLSQLAENSPATLQDREGRWTTPVTVGPARPSGRSYVVFKEDGTTTIRNRRDLRPSK